MNYRKIAEDVLNIVGYDNITSATNCVTRLRFVVKDSTKIDKAKLQALKGVLGVLEAGGQFQVIIGPEVHLVAKEVEALISGNGSAPPSSQPNTADSSNSASSSPPMSARQIFNVVFNYLSGSLSPLIPVMAGAGIIKGLAIALLTLKIITPSSGVYIVLHSAGDAVFHFLPIFVGFTAAKKLGANVYVGAAIGAALLAPTYIGVLNLQKLISQLGGFDEARKLIENLGSIPDASNLVKFLGMIPETANPITSNKITFLGLPIYPIDYASGIIPVLFAVALLAPLERMVSKVIPEALKMFLVPLSCLLVIVPITVLVFGPFGYWIGKFLSDLFLAMYSSSAILTGFIFGACWFILVMFGLHWVFVPIMITNISNQNYDIIGPIVLSSTYAQLGIALAIFLKSKDANLKTLASSSFVTGALTGITEPIVYGIIMQYKRVIGIALLGGGICGATLASLKVQQVVLNMGGVFGLASYQNNYPYYIATIVSTIIFTCILTILFGYESKSKTLAKN